MRRLLIALGLVLATLLPSPASADVQVGVGISVPGVSIGINVPAYPRLARVPGYPVYYAPGLSFNFFFYDGLYWVFQDDYWYSSGWYNGPWQRVDPIYVPVYVLRVPVRYYRAPPPYFHDWHRDAPPRWNEHWGHDWEAQRRDWGTHDRHRAPPPAPLPRYQRPYTGERYPQAEDEQHTIRSGRYRYEPRDEMTRRQYGPPGQRGAPSRPDRGHGSKDGPKGEGPRH